MSIQAQKEHCEYCFDVLVNHLQGKKDQVIPDFEGGFEVAIFVTWHKKNGYGGEDGWDLRGCIGSLSPLDFHSGLKRYALVSSLQDHRFEPVASAELNDLRCSVSLLVNFEENLAHDEWEVGVHGIIINFTDPKGGRQQYSATYLPEVAKEQGWTQIQAIKSLVRKAGYSGKVDDTVLNRISLTRYQSSKSALTYLEYTQSKS